METSYIKKKIIKQAINHPEMKWFIRFEIE